MAEYIEKGAFIAHICREAEGLKTKMPMDLVIAGVVNEVKSFPAADVASVRHGRLLNPNPYGECSLCGHLIDIRDSYNYCPNCGAKMGGGAE